MSIPQLVVFDLAGTVIRDQDEVAGALQFALKDFKLDPVQVRKTMGWPKPIAIAHLIGGDPSIEEIDRLHDDFVQEMIASYRRNFATMPHAAEVVGELRSKGVKVGLDTGFSREIGQVIFEQMGFEVDATVTSDEVVNGRPYPDMIYRLMELTGVTEVSKVAKVGDTPSDLQQGTTAGCPWVIGILHGTHSRQDLEAQPHTHLAADLLETRDILLGV